MADPWFNENLFGALFGAIGGSLGGILGGGWGAMVGLFAPQGKGRAWLIGTGWAIVGAGGLSLAFGLFALAAGQPYAIWYPPCLLGLVLAGVVGVLMPVVYKRYAGAEARRVQAEEFRGQ